jgi:hypothetical protein
MLWPRLPVAIWLPSPTLSAFENSQSQVTSQDRFNPDRNFAGLRQNQVFNDNIRFAEDRTAAFTIKMTVTFS